MECVQRRWTKGVNTFELVQNSELSEKITKIKLRKLQKIKLHVTSFEFISFWVIVVSFFLFICHKSHTTSLPGFKVEEIVTGARVVDIHVDSSRLTSMNIVSFRMNGELLLKSWLCGIRKGKHMLGFS